MKRGARLAALLAALLVLVGAWLLAESMSGRQQTEQAQEAARENIDISVGTAEDVTALSWTYFGSTVSLSYDAGADQWVNTDDRTCPIDGAAVEPMLQAVAGLEATMAVEGVTDFAQYGLDDPAITVMAATADNIVTYSVGNTTLEGAFYVRMNGEDTVYTETGALAPVFQAQLDDVLALETVPEMASVTGFAVETAGESYTMERRTDGAELWYTNAYQWFLDGEAGRPVSPLDSEQVKSLYGLVTDIRFLSCETWNAVSLSPYGLDHPQGKATVTYLDADGKTRTFSLEFGDYADGYVYTRLTGSRMVYLVSGTVLDGLMYPDLAAMAPLTVCPLDWDILQSALLQIDGVFYEVVHSVSTPTEEADTVEDIYTLGDRSLDPTRVASWLKQVSAFTADSLAGEGEGRDALFSLTFRQDSELWPEVTVQFRAYDSAHYLCVVNGSERYLVSRTAAQSLADDALEFLLPLPEAAPADDE